MTMNMVALLPLATLRHCHWLQSFKFVELLSIHFNRAPEEVIRQSIAYRYNAVKSKLGVLQGELRACWGRPPAPPMPPVPCFLPLTPARPPLALLLPLQPASRTS